MLKVPVRCTSSYLVLAETLRAWLPVLPRNATSWLMSAPVSTVASVLLL